MPKFFLSEKGFAPPIVLVLLVIILSTGFILYKSLPLNEPPASSDKGFAGFAGNLVQESSASATPSASSKSQIIAKKASPTPSASTKGTSPQTNSDSGSSSNASSNSSSGSSSQSNSGSTNTTTATPTPSPTPTATPSTTSYQYGGNNVNATVSCQIGSSSFNVSLSGSVTAPGSGKMLYGMLTGDGKTLTVMTQGGNNGSISANFNGSAGSVREGGVIELKASGTTLYSYQFKVYSGPESASGTPSLETQLANVEFATDCKY